MMAMPDSRRPRLALLIAALLAALPAVLSAQPCGTPGRDASPSLTGIVNTYYPGTASAAAGATSISVGSSSGAAAPIAAGDLLLVIQMQDAQINSTDTNSYGNGTAGDPASGSTALDSSGLYEYVVATGPVSGGSVPVLAGGAGGVLVNSYSNAAATGTRGQRRFQVIRVPQYTNPTLSSSLTALAWNGSVGGVLAIDVSGTLNLNGATVSVNGRGFRGGAGRTLAGNGTANAYRANTSGNAHGSKAEGIAGTPRYVYNGSALVDTGVEGYPNGSQGQGAPGNAGGGGTDAAADNGDNSGGGGGGNGGAGGRGGNTWTSNLARGGFGGAAFTPAANRLALGGGGGAGTSNNTGPGHGGVGVGLILVRANALSGTGTWTANGTTPVDSRQDGGGGGGAGGSIFVQTNAGPLPGLTLQARGGAGGDIDWNDDDHHGPGGGGGGGVLALSGTAASTSVTAGANGTSPASGTDVAFDATPGSTGPATLSTSGSFGARPGFICVTSNALVSGFRALPDRGAVVVEWETTSEAATGGFYLFRHDAKKVEWKSLTGQPLPAALESPQGAFYRFADREASAREEHDYVLIEVENTGRQRVHGPYRVRADYAAKGAFLDGDFSSEARPPTPVPPLTEESEDQDLAREKGGTPTALKVRVREKGLYTIPAATLATLFNTDGKTVANWIAGRQLSLTRIGRPVAWEAAADASEIRFYGEGIDTPYTNDAVYWLKPGAAGLGMTAVSGGRPAPAASPLVATDLLHAEQDRFAGIAIAPDPESDYWFWESLIGGDPSFGQRTFALTVPNPAPGKAALTVNLHGASRSGAPREHPFRLALNGTVIGESSFNGIAPYAGTFEVPEGLLADGPNTVEITALGDPSGALEIFYADSFDLSYPRLSRAGSGPLFVRPEGKGTATLSGFASPAVRIYDVSRPTTPAVVNDLIVDLDPAGGFRASFVPAAPGRLYVAVEGGYRRLPVLEPWTAAESPLLSPQNGAEHLILTPRAFAATAERLAEHRRRQGLSSRVVPLEQIYDEVSDGQQSPWAIQRLLAYAATYWKEKPQYVVLAGAGTFDYKDIFGLGGNRVPPLLLRTAEGLFASDSRFLSGSGVSIGRLPAESVAELEAAIAKIESYEAPPPGAWKSRAILVADDPDTGGQFDVESDRVAEGLPAPFTKERIYLGPLAPEAARQRLLEAWGQGAFLTTYLGHAGIDRLAAESLFTNDDAAALTNAATLPIFTAMTCIVGRFEIPGFAALSEKLVGNPAGGAIAAWSPAGLAYSAQSTVFGKLVTEELFAGRHTTLGAAIEAARARFAAAGGDLTTAGMYNLLGDPALVLAPVP